MPQLLSFSAIDRAAWDACVAASGTQLPYGYSDWLLAVGEGEMQGLVWTNGPGYKAVMPLFGQRKWGLMPYVSMPGLTQRLGLYARHPVEASAFAKEARSTLRRHFVRVDLSTEQGPVAEGLSQKVQHHSNLFLPFGPNLAEIEAGFGKSVRQKLKAAQKAGLEESICSPKEGFSFIAKHLQSQGKGWGPRQAAAATGLGDARSSHFEIKSTAAVLNRETLASAVWVYTPSRLIYLASASTQTGLEHGAVAWLIWQQIKAHAAKPNLVLDFEGGSMGGTGQFFTMFGAQPEPYWHLRIGV